MGLELYEKTDTLRRALIRKLTKDSPRSKMRRSSGLRFRKSGKLKKGRV